MAKPVLNGDTFLILDGALGTMLQAAGAAPGMPPEEFLLRHPDKVAEVHRAYLDARANLVCAATFGANRLKLEGSGHTVWQVVQAAVHCAKGAVGDAALVALDVGPLGQLLAPGGTLSFQEAYDAFAEVMRAGSEAGADVVLIETMTDLAEIRAAVLAAQECTSLPVLASMSFEEDGRSFAGVPVEAFAAAVGGLSVQALGINCSLGPAGIMPLLRRLCAATTLPVFAKPNAGLPSPETGEYTLSDEDFVRDMQPCLAMGASMVGGCCGTTPHTIRALAQRFANRPVAKRPPPTAAVVCGPTQVAVVNAPLAVGERINPTGKKRLQQALREGDLSHLQSLAVAQQAAGAAILDVNVGAPGIDETEMLPRAVQAVQAVCGLPLQLDSANPEALAAALRVCHGKPIVNSVSGEEEKLQAILPLVARYGAAVVGLAMDDDGIPETAEGRLAVAEKIAKAAQKHGIANKDIYIDCLTLTAGAQPAAATETLRAVRLVKEKLGLKTILGVSNVSFGLPNRPLVNSTFLTMALAAGLDLAILNPEDEGMMGALYAWRLLHGDGEGYLARYGGDEGKQPPPRPGGGPVPLGLAIRRGLAAEAAAAAKEVLASSPDAATDLMEQHLIPALDAVGEGFENKTIFLPQLLSAAAAAQAAFEVLRADMPDTAQKNGPPVVVATVQGDVHDIGKNIAKVLLQNYGFHVIDLGRDVAPEAVLQAVQQNGAALCGLSALMTTTLPAMQKTVQLLKCEAPACKVLVAGAVLTESYAHSIGADFYAKDATASADYARRVHQNAAQGG